MSQAKAVALRPGAENPLSIVTVRGMVHAEASNEQRY
jgi:hypothetical protein